IALDVLRALNREPESLDAFEAEVSRGAGAHPVLDEHLARTRTLAKEVSALASEGSSAAPAQARRLAEHLALALQAALLVRNSPTAVAEAFIGARLSAERGHLYGVLPTGTDLGAILERH